jgi:hypothetical protein
MPLIPDSAVFQQKLGALPIVKEDIEIAKVREPGAVLGELSALLDQPHTADVRALETSQFHVADASILLGKDPVALLYVASWRGGSTVPIRPSLN